MKMRILRIALILFATWLTVYAVQNKLIFHPMRWEGEMQLPTFPGRVLEPVSFKTSDGLTIHALWMVTASGSASASVEIAPASASRPVIVFSHGNAGNVLHRLTRLLALSALPMDLLVYDYRGFGRSEGSPNVEGVLLDGEAAVNWLKTVKGVSPHRMVLYGESIGTAVSVALAKRLEWKIGGLVLEAGFRSLKSRCGQTLPLLGPLALSADLPSDSLLPEFQGPLLIMHSKNDGVNSFSDSEQLFAVSTSPKKRFLAFAGYGHNDPLWDDPKYLPAWQQFLGDLQP